ncbi:DUF2066 domain-containing protein [Thiomicrospira sp. R3]|uniref:DUF2066 domain-containing protein n=1 Tax=Thiomicrospira sp. R3 TaxID=3035472 RepID=UPI00259B7FD8|nr:DUF2066 domain-containing protein [Thiomicrospira sp. R3]WFE68733.1 DUF2066 domain-containing protein [Thiomicrospira sp. R3]
MRSLILRLVISVFMLFPTVQAQDSLDLFKIEKPLEQYNVNELNVYLQQAMADLLVRLVGDAGFSTTPEAQKLIRNARQWVVRFQLVNREIDGVIMGQSLAVEFDRHRLLAEFHQSGINMWPLNFRPKTFMLGQWEQAGLLEDISAQSLEYRVDLDFRLYAQLLGLPIKLPEDRRIVELFPSPQTFFSANRINADFVNSISDGHQFLFVYKADRIGEVISWAWRLYSLENGELVLEGEEVGESFLALMASSLDRLLAFYSAPYRQGLGNVGLIDVEIANITSFQIFNLIESSLSDLQPIVTNVRLAELQADKVKFEVTYNGQLSNLFDQLDLLKQIEWTQQSLFQGQLKGRYQP